jgi:VanZ family protein
MRWAFVIYAPLLFLGTHWPQLVIPLPGRPDLVVHLTIFGGWTILLFLSGLAGDPRSWRTVAVVQLVAVLYAAIDEGLQAIPFIRRTFAWDDMMFDTFGVVLGTMVNMWLRAFLDRRSPINR